MSRGVCIITGGSRGIGAAAVRKIGRAGWDVLINYHRSRAAAEALVKEMDGSGGRAELIAADASTEEGLMRIFEAADAMGRLTGLVNNAGITAQVGTLDTFATDRIEKLVRLNLTSVILASREAVKRMARRHGGSGGVIVNLGSAASKLGSPGMFVDYAATKGAVDTFTVGLALEWAGEGIRVNAVRPGLIDTDIHETSGTPNRVAEAGPSLPMGRAGTADEVAEAILWLMSDASSYTTGAILDVSGGRSAVP